MTIEATGIAPRMDRKRSIFDALDRCLSNTGTRIEAIPVVGDVIKGLSRTDLVPSQRAHLAIREGARSAGYQLDRIGRYVFRKAAQPLPFISKEFWGFILDCYGFVTAILAQILYLPTNWVLWAVHTMINVIFVGLTKNDKANHVRKTILHWFIRITLSPIGYPEKGLRILVRNIVENLDATGGDEPVVGWFVVAFKSIKRLFRRKDKQ